MQTYSFGPVHPKGASKPVDDFCGMYEMDGKHRGKYHGLALIINNLESDPKKGIKTSAVNDAKNMKILFEYLGYKVEEEKKGLSKDQMMTAFKQTAASYDANYDSFICCILSYGGAQGKLVGSGEEPVYFNDIVDIFNGDVCKPLKGKPKIFFVNACRGTKKMPTTLAVPPDTADFLFCFPTVESYVTYTSSEGSGSCYIEEICKVITENATHSFLSDMMTKVCENVGGVKKKNVQSPEITSRLTKHVYFF